MQEAYVLPCIFHAARCQGGIESCNALGVFHGLKLLLWDQGVQLIYIERVDQDFRQPQHKLIELRLLIGRWDVNVLEKMLVVLVQWTEQGPSQMLLAHLSKLVVSRPKYVLRAV